MVLLHFEDFHGSKSTRVADLPSKLLKHTSCVQNSFLPSLTMITA